MTRRPSESTTLLMFEVYRNAFVYTRFGYARHLHYAPLVIAVAVTVQNALPARGIRVLSQPVPAGRPPAATASSEAASSMRRWWSSRCSRRFR